MRFPDDQLDMFSQEKHPHLHDFDEHRSDMLGHNGNDGLHYKAERVGDEWLHEYGLMDGAQ